MIITPHSSSKILLEIEILKVFNQNYSCCRAVRRTNTGIKKVFLIFVRKFKTRGATRSQNCTSSVVFQFYFKKETLFCYKTSLSIVIYGLTKLYLYAKVNSTNNNYNNYNNENNNNIIKF